MNVSMIKKVKADKNGDLYLQFTSDELKELGFKIGDHMEWFEKDGALGFKKVKE